MHSLINGVHFVHMCLYPKLIKNRKYLPNKKNGGQIPIAADERVKVVPIGCGKCIECRKQKANEWRVRLMEEIRNDRRGLFMTMTFSEEALVKFEQDDAIEVAAKAIELFRKRWWQKYKEGIKHFLVAELGHSNTNRLHLHGIIWTDKSKEEIEERWQYGWIDTGEYVNEKSINYIVKYITKNDEDHPGFITKIWTSKGIGKSYTKSLNFQMNRYNGLETRDYYRLPNGVKTALPIYYRNKIYTEEEREKLWLQRLDKKERWVCGERISVKNEKGMRLYFKCLEYHQRRSISLGYSSDPWIKKAYRKSLEVSKLCNTFVSGKKPNNIGHEKRNKLLFRSDNSLSSSKHNRDRNEITSDSNESIQHGSGMQEERT